MEEGSLSRLLNGGKVIPLWKETLDCGNSYSSRRVTLAVNTVLSDVAISSLYAINS
jgi:hypothetical protein